MIIWNWGCSLTGSVTCIQVLKMAICQVAALNMSGYLFW